jgi:hypothetical protein
MKCVQSTWSKLKKNETKNAPRGDGGNQPPASIADEDKKAVREAGFDKDFGKTHRHLTKMDLVEQTTAANECQNCGATAHKEKTCPANCANCGGINHKLSQCKTKKGCRCKQWPSHKMDECKELCLHKPCNQSHPAMQCPIRCCMCGSFGHVSQKCPEKTCLCGRGYITLAKSMAAAAWSPTAAATFVSTIAAPAAYPENSTVVGHASPSSKKSFIGLSLVPTNRDIEERCDHLPARSIRMSNSASHVRDVQHVVKSR